MKIMIQATHMGRRSAYRGDPWPHLVSPSGVREQVHRGTSKSMEIEDIRRIVRDFAVAVKRVQTSGMDGVEISAAHQQLIDQFWSPETNLRSDEYGGSLENRMRFGIEVLEAVREAVGRDFCVGLRMCADEFNDNGIDHEMAREIAQAMSETGLIDFISVSARGRTRTIGSPTACRRWRSRPSRSCISRSASRACRRCPCCMPRASATSPRPSVFSPTAGSTCAA